MDTTKLPIPTIVVDDDRLMRCLLTDLLNAAGFEVRTAGSCKQALTLFDEFPAELIICDWELPDAAGIDLVRHVRYVQNIRRPFILMVSAHRTNLAVEQALRAGANDYLAKPIRKDELIARTQEIKNFQLLEQELAGPDLHGHITVSHGYYSLYAS
ncbi:response regulator [Blastopirellula retiformator]|uniref:Transcriptional regulatory protein OmpR n=1 Tax=Blastopirellula retiformator TaxID=2527970 RepID=A0A5C5UUC5_9BACT|nr:response regulator [Blastopirellula retiformator]TWT30034.1 Transcriptional regulatory protein OmpR [Blastopirellula retiformator]